MSRAQKADTVQALSDMLASSETVVVFQHKGLTVAEFTDLRVKSRAQGGLAKVTKNRLMTRALKGSRFEALEPLFKGTTAIIVSKDPVAAAKVTFDYAKGNDKISIVGGAMGAKVLDRAGIEALAKLPSLDQLRGQIVGVLQAPAAKIARILQAPAQQLIGVTAAQGRKG
ncbi:MAG: 50S ribosomal protein L10 [Rhodospirillales bacterium]|nr:50S ribosomal protein L10 [Alphaproteobacteria bacterium]MCB9986498.1 50S ribosomal protein L10 [Rhodospirillales bacterium]USO08611.1 MAG: 50S ribosomal protein L10 [Rhodospirillales bacterium]